MKLRFRREVAVGVSVICGLGALCLRSKVIASPSTSPSAIMAAKLKYTPPPGWIRHYLGDDRYKIDGNIWRVVSTQMDTYYHRPNCPNMLRQSRDTVIGFPSGEDAVEAGYQPDPVCHPEAGTVSYIGGSDMGAPSDATPTITTENHTKAAMRIKLADGVSTVLLPPNWRRVQSGAVVIGGRPGVADVLQPLDGKSTITFSSLHIPGNINAEPLLQPSKANTLANYIRQKDPSNPYVRLADNATISGGSFGGLTGSTFTPKPGSSLPDFGNGRLLIGARGSKVYLLKESEGLSQTAGANAVIKSFQPH